MFLITLWIAPPVSWWDKKKQEATAAFKTPGGDAGGQEVSVSLAAAMEISIGAADVALSGPDGIFFLLK